MANPIDPSAVVDKKVAVRFQFVTEGMEALSVQLSSGGGNSRPAHIEDGGRCLRPVVMNAPTKSSRARLEAGKRCSA